MTTTTIDLQEILHYYRRTDKDPLRLGRMLHEAAEEAGGQQQLHRKLFAADPAEKGITAGTIHHYVSILALPDTLKAALLDKRLTFKEARAFADIHDHDDLLELVKPFLSRELSSNYVEWFTKMVKQFPDLNISDRIMHAKNRTMPKKSAPVEPPTQSTVKRAELTVDVPQPQRPRYNASAGLVERIVGISGEIAHIPDDRIPEYQRKNLAHVLRILDRKVHEAMEALNGPN